MYQTTPIRYKTAPTFHTPPAVAPLTPAQLTELFRPLQRDYAATVAATATLPIKERAPLIQTRIEAYSVALSEALGAALDDATAQVIGSWARGGR
jgi:hypothetical protein